MSLTVTQKLRENAADFARTYVRVTEAMLAEGVPEDMARFEARWAALAAVLSDGGEDERQRGIPGL